MKVAIVLAVVLVVAVAVSAHPHGTGNNGANSGDKNSGGISSGVKNGVNSGANNEINDVDNAVNSEASEVISTPATIGSSLIWILTTVGSLLHGIVDAILYSGAGNLLGAVDSLTGMNIGCSLRNLLSEYFSQLINLFFFLFLARSLQFHLNFLFAQPEFLVKFQILVLWLESRFVQLVKA